MSRLIRKLSALFLLALWIGGLFGFIAQPGIAIIVAWFVAELAAYDSDIQSFDAFELNRTEDAELRSLAREAADVTETLASLDTAGQQGPKSERLGERYLQLQTRIMTLSERPPARLRRWSFRRAGRFSLRLTILAGVFFGGGLIYLVTQGTITLPDGRRYFDVFLYVWSATALPYALGRRRMFYENSLGDLAAFLAHWDIQGETIDAHVNSLLRERQFARQTPPRSEPPREPPPATDEPPSPPARPKRPWDVVLEVDRSADAEAVHRAYRRQMMLYHPDHTRSLGAELQALAEIISREIREAYEESKAR
jgi:DnaJ domain